MVAGRSVVVPPDGLEGGLMLIVFLLFLTTFTLGISVPLFLLVTDVMVLLWFRYVYSVGDFLCDPLLTFGLLPFLFEF